MDAITKAYDADVQIIDTPAVRAHQQGATGRGGGEIVVSVAHEACLPRKSMPSLTRRAPDPAQAEAGQANDIASAAKLTGYLASGAMLLAEKADDANALRALVGERGAWANIPPKSNRKDPICFSRHLYRDRNLIERFFNKIKQFRRITTCYDNLAENILANLKLACVRIWLRGNGSTA